MAADVRMDFALRSQRVVTPDGVRPACVIIEGERIARTTAHSATPSNLELTDVGNRMVLPGLVDTHVHVNEPGRTEWEGFATATRAAAAGGYTALVDMPLNGFPATTTVAALEEKRAAARGQCWIDFGVWGGVVPDNQIHLAGLAEAGVLGYKCFLVNPGIEGFTMVTREKLEAAMPIVAQSGLPLLIHAELPGPIEAARRELDQVPSTDWRSYQTYLRSRPDKAELDAIRQMIQLAGRYDCDVHIVHLSSSRALPALHSARNAGVPLTVETCPH